MRRAFTLIEILVAISVMVIMLGVGMVAYQNVNRKQALDQTMAGLVQTLAQAQANALSGKKQNCATSLAGWQLRFTTNDYVLEEACSVPGGSFPVKTVTYPLSITGTIPSINPILYRGLNQGTNISAASTTITLTSGSLSKTVTVLSSGAVQ